MAFESNPSTFLGQDFRLPTDPHGMNEHPMNTRKDTTMDREIDKRIKKAIDDARAYLEDLNTFISRTKTHLKKNGFCVMGGEIDRASGYEKAREDVSDLIYTLNYYEYDQDPTDCAAQVRAQIDQLHLDLETLATQVVGNVPKKPWEFIRVTTAIGACREVLGRLEEPQK